MKLCTKFERNRAIRGRVIAISVFDLMTLNIALGVALGSGIIFTKFDLPQLICARIIAFLCLYIMSRCDLDLWPLDLHHFGCKVFKLCTKFEERNRIIHGWVIDDLARFPVQFYGVGQNWQSFVRDAWTQLHQTWPEHREIIAALHFYFIIRISRCIFKCGQLKAEWCFKRRQISHLLTPCEN